MPARKTTAPDEVTEETFDGEPVDEALPPAESLYDDAVELEADVVVHAVRRPGGLVAEYIRGADGVVRREVRKLEAAELEAEEQA